MKTRYLVLVAFALCGCTPVGEIPREQAVVLRQERGCVVTILVDLSGSFEEKMLKDGKAYAFCMGTIDNYFKDRFGENDELVIGQISGTTRTLLWQGTPTQLRRDFAGPQQLSEFLKKHAVPSGSNVYESLALSVDYLATDPDVVSGKAKSAVLVLSDMLDNDPNQAAAKEHLRRALTGYSQRGGAIGCYFVDHAVLAECRGFIRDSGIKNFVVESEIIGNPRLPLIE